MGIDLGWCAVRTSVLPAPCPDQGKPVQLYNIARDPIEQYNMASTHPGVVKVTASIGTLR